MAPESPFPSAHRPQCSIDLLPLWARPLANPRRAHRRFARHTDLSDTAAAALRNDTAGPQPGWPPPRPERGRAAVAGVGFDARAVSTARTRLGLDTLTGGLYGQSITTLA